jgi:hypothetical protein
MGLNFKGLSGWKLILLPLVALVLIAASCFDYQAIDEPGVLSQKVCADFGNDPPPDCVNVTDTKMWKGRPNGVGYVALVLGLGIFAWWGFMLFKSATAPPRPPSANDRRYDTRNPRGP